MPFLLPDPMLLILLHRSPAVTYKGRPNTIMNIQRDNKALPARVSLPNQDMGLGSTGFPLPPKACPPHRPAHTDDTEGQMGLVQSLSVYQKELR